VTCPECVERNRAIPDRPIDPQVCPIGCVCDCHAGWLPMDAPVKEAFAAAGPDGYMEFGEGRWRMHYPDGSIWIPATEPVLTWHDIAADYPQFVQWCVATYGPLPDGKVRQEDYERLAAAFNRAWLEAHSGTDD
jgi:hypothetical protein